MFVRKETRDFETGSYRVVPFCKDCDSHNIETIQTCKECGSHNIGTPTLFGDDKRGMIPEIISKDFHIYKCDRCGEEFDAFEVPNLITLDCGEFVPYKVEEDEYHTEPAHVISLKEDLCAKCRQTLVDILNRKLSEIASQENVDKVLKDMIDK